LIKIIDQLFISTELALSTTISILVDMPSSVFGTLDHQSIALALNKIKEIDSRLSGKSSMNPLRSALQWKKWAQACQLQSEN
jgi:hypothetical protein